MPRNLNAISHEEREVIYQAAKSSDEPRHQIAKKHDISLSALYNLQSRHKQRQEESSAVKFVEVKPPPNIEQRSPLEGLQAANFEFREYSIELRGKFPHKILLDILQIPEAVRDV